MGFFERDLSFTRVDDVALRQGKDRKCVSALFVLGTRVSPTVLSPDIRTSRKSPSIPTSSDSACPSLTRRWLAGSHRKPLRFGFRKLGGKGSIKVPIRAPIRDL